MIPIVITCLYELKHSFYIDYYADAICLRIVKDIVRKAGATFEIWWSLARWKKKAARTEPNALERSHALSRYIRSPP